MTTGIREYYQLSPDVDSAIESAFSHVSLEMLLGKFEGDTRFQHALNTAMVGNPSQSIIGIGTVVKIAQLKDEQISSYRGLGGAGVTRIEQALLSFVQK
jgi:hypothetical protein